MGVRLSPVQVVRELSGAGGRFRVLALSATPGSDLQVGLPPPLLPLPPVLNLHPSVPSPRPPGGSACGHQSAGELH